jgi:AraC family transcriptional regulator of adaptative response/methylated-DNA-[protein]-cysteine methyltransferase
MMTATAERDPRDVPVRLHDPEAAWTAVLDRDPRFDGRFVYAVETTGVYCRPTCPSRRPARRHVRFYPAPAAAEEAGFRACLRCRPKDGETPAAAAIERARAFLEAHPEEAITLARLGNEVGLSPSHLQRAFKAVHGISPKDYARARRAQRFKAEVRRGRSVTDALYEAGYSSGSRLYEDAGPRLGMTPAAYRRGGQGVRIAYAIAASAVGRLLVGATDRGVCVVQLGESDAALEDSLRREYPKARLDRDDDALSGWLAAVLGALRGETRTVPLDLDASAFERRVWKELQRIPFGSTRSYADVARAVGRPGAARAVARACARNPVALVIPCHRVVRSDGSVGGYRWGAARKQRLLEAEGRRAAGSRRDR